MLRPLVWFGLLEQRARSAGHSVDPQQYRTMPLYDELLRFAVSPPRDIRRAS